MGSSTSSASSSTREEGDVTTGRGGDAPTVGRLARITRRKMSRTGHGSSSVQSSSCLKTVSNVEAATEQHKEEEEEAEGGKKRVVQTRSKNESIVESVCLFCLFVFFFAKRGFRLHRNKRSEKNRCVGSNRETDDRKHVEPTKRAYFHSSK